MAGEAGMGRNSTCDVEVVELDDAEGAEMFDQVTRQKMGMSGTEFLRRWDAGEWTEADLDKVDGLVDVWMMLPFAR
jgi:hypothetical protein